MTPWPTRPSHRCSSRRGTASSITWRPGGAVPTSPRLSGCPARPPAGLRGRWSSRATTKKASGCTPSPPTARPTRSTQPTELPERLRDGSRSFQVGTSEAQFGWADGIEGGPIDVGVADVPAGVNLPDYELATFEADGPLGVSHVSLSARLGGTPGAGINGRVTFGTLPRDGDDISVRVGSCLQWHGFDTRHLYLTQIDGRTIDRITLSGVKD